MNTATLFTTVASINQTSVASLFSIQVIILFTVAFLICIYSLFKIGTVSKLRSQTIYYKLIFALAAVMGAFLGFVLISAFAGNSSETILVQNLEKPRSEVYVIRSVELSNYTNQRNINYVNSLSFQFGCLGASRALYLKACDPFYVKDLPARAISLTGHLTIYALDGSSDSESSSGFAGSSDSYSRDILNLKQGAELGESVVSGIIPFNTANKFIASANDDAKSFYFNYLLSYYKEDSSFSNLKAFTNLVSNLSQNCLNLPRPVCNDFKRAYIEKVAEYSKKPAEIGNLDAVFEESLDLGVMLQ